VTAVTNVGVGPALSVQGEFRGPHGLGVTQFPTEAVAVGAHGVVAFENSDGDSLAYAGNDPPVSAVITHEDAAGRVYGTTAQFDPQANAYRSTFQIPKPRG